MKYLLAVDGGGTKTEFCVSDTAGKIIATVTSGSSSFKSVGQEQSLAQLKKGMAMLKAQHQIEPELILKGVFGMSGCDSRQDQEIIMQQIRQLGFHAAQIHLCNDGVLAFYAQTGEPGIVVIAGTGSIVLGIDQQRLIIRSGGWGYHFSDIGSGYWIGSKILEKTLLYCDHCSSYDPVYERIREHFGAESFDQLRYKVTEIRNTSEIAGLASGVVQAAEDGNQISMDILTEGSAHLAMLVEGVFHQLGLVGQRLMVVCSGGVLTSPLYKKMLEEAVSARLKDQVNDQPIEFLSQKNRPSLGGIRLAQRLIRQGE